MNNFPEVLLGYASSIFVGIIASVTISFAAYFLRETREAVRLVLKQMLNDISSARSNENILLALLRASLRLNGVILNIPLASVTYNLKIQREKKDKQVASRGTIVELMIGVKSQRNGVVQLALIFAVVSYTYFTRIGLIEWSNIPFIFAVVYYLAIQLENILINYRVSNGWYGSNEFESREIIGFILTHADVNDFSGPGGTKKVSPEPMLEQETLPNLQQGVKV